MDWGSGVTFGAQIFEYRREFMACSECGCGKEAQDAKKWFVTSLVIAVGLVLFIFCVDKTISNPASEIKHAEEMRRLRVAATNLPSGVTDDRQLGLSARTDTTSK